MIGGGTWSDEGWIEGFDSVGGHNNLYISARIKAVKLVQELQHCSLNFTFTARVGVVSILLWCRGMLLD